MDVISIPDDCWYMVFQKLDSICDQESFGLTCHRFLYIQNSSRKRLKLAFSMNPHATNIESIVDTLVNRFRQLHILYIGDYYFRVTDSCFTSLPSKLRFLYLQSTAITDIGLGCVASACQFLSVISLRQCSVISDSGLEILTKSCRLLKQVDLSRCKKITDCGILSLNQNCRKLRALNISGCQLIKGETFQGCSPELAYLEAQYCALDQKCVAGIVSGGGIEYLNFFKLYNGLAMNGLGSAANLKSLNLSKCKLVDDIAITEISKGCPLLEEWDVSWCTEIGLSGWESIGLHCQNLERINVDYCFKFCDRGLEALGNGCKRLKMIWMEFYHPVTQNGILKFKKQRKDVQINGIEMKIMALNWAVIRQFHLTECID